MPVSSPYTININPDGTPQVEVPNNTVSGSADIPMNSDQLAIAALPIDYKGVQGWLDAIGINVSVNPGTVDIFTKISNFIMDNPGLSMIIGLGIVMIATGGDLSSMGGGGRNRK